MASTCFEPRGFILSYIIVLYIHQYCMYNTLYHTGIYNRLPGDEPSGSKHVEGIKI